MSSPVPRSNSRENEIQEILLEDDLWNWNFSYVETDRNYASRRLSYAIGEILKRDSKDMIASVLIPLLAAIVAGVGWGSIWRGLVAGLLTVIPTILLIWFLHWLVAPKEMDQGIRGDLAAAKNQLEEEKRKVHRIAAVANKYESERANSLQSELNELKKHKLTFEVDQRGASLTKIRTDQDRDGSVVRIMLDLQLRFDNKDTAPIFMRGLHASFHQEGILNVKPARDVSTRFAILQATSNGSPVDAKYFRDGMQISGRQVTDFYVVKMLLAIEDDEDIRGVAGLQALDYLKVTMRAGGHQPDLVAKLVPYWTGAASPEGTTQILIFGVETLERDYRRLDDFSYSQ